MVFPFGAMNKRKACLAMVTTQFLYAGMALMSKAALSKGMNQLVFVVYRQAIATVFLAPFAYTLERTKAPPLSCKIFFKIFLLSLCGLTPSLELYYMALRYTTATFASTIINTIPVITFIISISLRIETINLKTIYGRLKILGIIVCVGGTVLLCLYEGPPLKFLYSHRHASIGVGSSGHAQGSRGEKQNLVKGSLLMLAGYTTWSIWLVAQAAVVKVYPAKLRLTTMQCFLSTLMSAVSAMIFDQNPSSWRLGWNIELLSVAYCAVFVTGVSYGLQIWCIEQKGPVYAAMFSPLSLVITSLFSSLLWSEYLHSGSVLGGLLIVSGLYCVLWGKSKEDINMGLEDQVCKREIEGKLTVDLEMA